jgi:large subunit ribosomal protein L24
MRLKKDDTVKVIAGKDKGKTGRILSTDAKEGRVLVQGVNMVKKAVKRKNQQDKGGFVQVEAPIAVSNVAYVTKDGKTTRIGYKFDENGNKVRYAKKTGETL